MAFYNQLVSGRGVKFNQKGILQVVERSSISEAFEDLLNVGIALSSIHDLQRLLEFILTEARRLTQADAGTLYLVHENKLVFRVSQCRSLTERLGEPVMRQHYESFEMPISPASIAGYAALNREVLNIPDVGRIPAESSYHYNCYVGMLSKYKYHPLNQRVIGNHVQGFLGMWGI